MGLSTKYPNWHNGESFLKEDYDAQTPRNAVWSDGESGMTLRNYSHLIAGVSPAKVAGQEVVSIVKVGGEY